MGAAKDTEFAKKSGWNDMMEKSLASAKENNPIFFGPNPGTARGKGVGRFAGGILSMYGGVPKATATVSPQATNAQEPEENKNITFQVRGG